MRHASEQRQVIDHGELSLRQELMLDAARSLADNPKRLLQCAASPDWLIEFCEMLAAWLEREAYLSAGEAAGLRATGARPDVADAVAEDNPGFLLAYSAARRLSDQ